MKFFSLIFLLGMMTHSFAKETVPTRFYDVRNRASKIEEKAVVATLRDFIKKTKPSRLMGTPGHDQAISFISDFISSVDKEKTGVIQVLDFNPDFEWAKKFYELDFKLKVEGKIPPTDPAYKNWKNFTSSMDKTIDQFIKVKGSNIVWEKKGKNPNQVIVIGANYDTMNVDPKTNMVDLKSVSPGADKNGTGVTALLYTIQELAKVELNKTIRIVFFDYQSIGYLGAKAYVEELGKEKMKNKDLQVEAFFGVEMIGYDTITADKEKKNGNFHLYYSNPGKVTYSKEKDLAATISKLNAVMMNGVTFKEMPNGFEYSDNIIFQDAGIPSLVFSQNWDSDFNNMYHTPNDFVERINQKSFHRALTTIVGSAISLALEINK